jgi:hypothetical protein
VTDRTDALLDKVSALQGELILTRRQRDQAVANLDRLRAVVVALLDGDPGADADTTEVLWDAVAAELERFGPR